MLNSIIAFLLLLLSIFPSFNTKVRIENRLKDRLSPVENSISRGEELRTEINIVPEKSPSFSEISSSSDAALFLDATSGEILFEKNKDMRLPMASITKLMTALVAIENTEPSDIVTVPKYNTLPLDTMMGALPGEKLKVRELMHGLLIESGADAAQSLAIHISGSEQKFVALMNERATKLGLMDTQFTNSIGHDSSGHYSTASDLARLSEVVLSNPLISEIVAKSSYTATGENGKKYVLSNTNKLLFESRYIGAKTGTTYSAGQCLVSVYKEGERKIIGVLLDSPDRFYETEKIIEWTKRSFTW